MGTKLSVPNRVGNGADSGEKGRVCASADVNDIKQDQGRHHGTQVTILDVDNELGQRFRGARTLKSQQRMSGDGCQRRVEL